MSDASSRRTKTGLHAPERHALASRRHHPPPGGSEGGADNRHPLGAGLFADGLRLRGRAAARREPARLPRALWLAALLDRRRARAGLERRHDPLRAPYRRQGAARPAPRLRRRQPGAVRGRGDADLAAGAGAGRRQDRRRLGRTLPPRPRRASRRLPLHPPLGAHSGARRGVPGPSVSNTLYEIDRERLTCAGGIAALDMMHALIEADHGHRLASAVSDWFLHSQVRLGSGPQRMTLRERFGVTHPRLLRVLERMEGAIEEPASRTALADLAGISPRQLERLFQAHLGLTIGEHYLRVRLDRAQALLRQTTMPVIDVAVACGFVSASHFSRSYRARFGFSPRAERIGRAAGSVALSARAAPSHT